MSDPRISVRIHEGPAPTLIYLPGLHGDWGLIGAFRRALAGKVRFVEIAYPRDCAWDLDAHAAAVDAALRADGISRGWILGQSFGSQVAWAMAHRGAFRIDGLILAGGFVSHPSPAGARRFLRFLLAHTPTSVLRVPMSLWVEAGALLLRRNPETVAELRDFVRNRTDADWDAAARRLTLMIRARDPRPVARAANFPVHYLGGLIDPLVAWPLVVWWLKGRCPGYQGSRILPLAGHNVLGSQPERSAEQVLAWLAAPPPRP
ncbi:MAG: alpha/beta hydrolase [Elusimicrobia bacterium]|nr:alpha/beta hydrolase [Elusimicrobiota bacterium]